MYLPIQLIYLSSIGSENIIGVDIFQIYNIILIPNYNFFFFIIDDKCAI